MKQDNAETEVVAFVQFAYDRKLVMTLDALKNMLDALMKAEGTWEGRGDSLNVTPFDVSLDIRLMTRAKLKQIQLEGAISS